MKKFYSKASFLPFSFLLVFSLQVKSQNLGFEATPATAPPTNWTAVTGTWTVNTNATYVRTGLQSMTITDPATTGTTLGTTNPVITTTAPGYLIAIGWGKANVPSNGLFYLGYRTGTANTLNPTTTTSGQPPNVNDVTWSRITSVSASATIAAGSYGVSLRAFRSATTPSTSIYFDDIIIYSSTSNVPDLTAPNAPSNVSVSGNQILWTNGTDNGSPASGIAGVVIIRANGVAVPPPVLNDQAMYNPVNGAAGVGSFIDNSITWTVVADIAGSSTTSFTDASGTSGPYTYVVYMRDMAYNYSPGTSGSAATPCTAPPTPGTTTSNASATICAGSAVNIGLSGNSFGTGQTYQLQQSASQTGPYTNVGSSQSASSFSVNPTSTTWYQVAVTCSGNTQTSVPVQVVVTSGISGTYTINSALATGGTNFQSFTAAVSALGCGVTGPVVFNVVAGTYNEQISIPQLTGVSAANTVTFNGNGDTIMFNSTVGAKHIIQLDGADFIRIKNLVIQSTNATYGWGVHLQNGANNNLIDSCTIDMELVTSTTIDNSAGIVVANSTSDLNADGSASNNTISNNTIKGGYQGIVINGSATALNAVGNIITKNTIHDFYSVGIELTDNDGTQITFNNIHRANRVAVTTFEGVELGIGNQNVIVNSNRIHDTHNSATTQTGAAYGVFSTANDAPAGSENRIFNNVIYNFNSGSGIIYGLYNSTSDGVRYYHNTVVLDNAASTGGVTRGFYQVTAATNIEFRNNIIYITRGGTGTKHALYFGTTTSTIVSNNNVLYVNATGSTVGIGSWGTANAATLANWQTASSGDLQSIDVDPQFASVATGNFYPNNSTITVGANVGVTTDILGLTRSTTAPTPGAYEIIISVNADIGAVDLFAPIQKSCYSSTETVRVRIKNYSASTHNFATAPVTVNVSSTGPNATTFTPVIINTGTLPSGDTLNVLILSTYNMTAPGTYKFNASTSVTGDANPTNNAMAADSVIVSALSAGTVSSNPGSYCVTGGTPILTTTGSGGGSLQWQEAASASGPWTNVGTNNNTYTPASAITATRYYRVIATCNANNDTSAVVTVSLFNPQIVSTTPGVRCGPGTVTLSATGATGTTFNWYTAATGGTPVFTGASFTTPVINATTTYYVAASSGGSSNISVGLPAALTTATSGAGTTNFGLVFDALAAFTLNAVTIYPVSAAANTPGTVTIDVINSAGTVVQTTTVNVLGNPGGSVGQTVTLNFNIPAGTNYKLRPGARSASITGLLFEPSASAPGGNYGYPFVLPGILSINTSTLTAAPANTARNDLYYYFYNWTVATGCESPRQAVTATVNTAPAFDVTNDVTVCNNAITTLQVNSALANFNTYTWSPATGLFTNAAATTAYTTGTSASMVYAKIATPGTYTFYATANNTTTTCQNIDSVKITVLPASITVVPSPDRLCVSGTSVLNISPNPSTFGGATYQWSSSTNNTTYTSIAGATGTSYTTPTITATTYYQVDIKNSAGAVCLTAYDTVIVNSPQILTTTPAALCGTGSMTLGATATAGTTVQWYTAAAGGSLVGTGNSFTTPNLTTTTTYYAAALAGGGGIDVGIKINEFAICGFPVTSTTTDYAVRFTTTKTVQINSAYVIPQSTSLTVALRAQGSTTNLQSQTFTFSAAQVGNPVQINLGWSVAPGNYQLVNTSGGLWRITTLGCGYPFTSPGGGFSITGSATSSTGAANTTTYNGFYQINVTEGCESPRVAVVAQVSANTAITQQPQNISTCVGASVNLVVGASGANLVYQWRRNGVNVTNSNNDTLTLSPVTLANAGTYDVVITGLCGGAVTSQTMTLNVAAGNTWLGTVSSDWNVTANWCGGIPTASSDVSIFPGTPYQPVVNATLADVRTLTINTGAIVTLMPNATMNIHGDFINNGTFSAANAFIFFKGTTVQNIGGMTVGNAVVNGAGVVLTGTMTVNQTLTLTSGNLTVGINNLSVAGSVNGTLNSHIVTNSSGSVITRNVTTAAVIVPVGPSAASYNPVTINNGGGRDYSVKVTTGLNPTIANPGLAVNRTWDITPSIAPASAVSITFQYEDTHMNTPGVATNNMEVGVHNGTSWAVVTPSVTPSGSPTSRQVVSTTNQFGPMVVTNIGGISWITAAPSVDPTVSSMMLMPNIVESKTLLRIISSRAARINLQVTDANGRVVLAFGKQILTGTNDIMLELGKLAAGTYTITGQTDKGKTQMLRFVKM